MPSKTGYVCPKCDLEMVESIAFVKTRKLVKNPNSRLRMWVQKYVFTCSSCGKKYVPRFVLEELKPDEIKDEVKL